jgi:hypothetical protein
VDVAALAVSVLEAVTWTGIGEGAVAVDMEGAPERAVSLWTGGVDSGVAVDS